MAAPVATIIGDTCRSHKMCQAWPEHYAEGVAYFSGLRAYGGRRMGELRQRRLAVRTAWSSVCRAVGWNPDGLPVLTLSSALSRDSQLRGSQGALVHPEVVVYGWRGMTL